MRAADLEAPVFNVCTGVPVSVRELAGTIADLLGMQPDIRLQPPRVGEIRHSLGSSERVRSVLGLSEPVRLRDGLANVLDWLGPPAP